MKMMSLGFVCNYLVLVHAELAGKTCVTMVIVIREEQYLGFISEKKMPHPPKSTKFCGLTSSIIAGIVTT